MITYFFQAKTPAHLEFRSKYYRGPALLESSASVPNSPNFDDIGDDEDDVNDGGVGGVADGNCVNKSARDESQVKWRAEAVHRRSLARWVLG